MTANAAATTKGEPSDISKVSVSYYAITAGTTTFAVDFPCLAAAPFAGDLFWNDIFRRKTHVARGNYCRPGMCVRILWGVDPREGYVICEGDSGGFRGMSSVSVEKSVAENSPPVWTRRSGQRCTRCWHQRYLRHWICRCTSKFSLLRQRTTFWLILARNLH